MFSKSNFNFPFFVGHGYDVHVFDDDLKRPLYLAGVHIPDEIGLKAHSDGDVVLHALCDALLGAAGLMDIGCWFPDTDQAYANIDSKILLKRVLEKIYEIDFVPVNADITIICQRPKLSGFFSEMKDVLTELLGGARINIKATTTEGTNAEGEGKCIATHAVCLIAQKNFVFSKNFK